MLAFLGGSGPEGRGLALRLAQAGEDVIIGSRDADRGKTVAAELTLSVNRWAEANPEGSFGALGTGRMGQIDGADNFSAAQQGDTVFLTIPYEGQKPMLEQLAQPLAGKVVVNVIAPMRFERGRGAIAVPVPDGSAAAEAQALLPNSPVVAAFQNISAEKLNLPDQPLEGDVVVCSDYPDAKELIMALTEKIPLLRPVDGGGLANAQYIEQLTPLLVNINRIYKTHSTIRILGV